MGRIDFSSRLSLRAVAAGSVIELVTLSLLMVLGGGLGLWSTGVLDGDAVRNASSGLAIWAGAALVVSALTGAWVAAIASRSQTRRNGLLHGLVTWATACFAAGLLACTWFMAALAVDTATIDAAEAIASQLPSRSDACS